jgi:hypothetical protein
MEGNEICSAIEEDEDLPLVCKEIISHYYCSMHVTAILTVARLLNCI